MNRSASPRSTRWRFIASWIWSNVGMRRRPIWVEHVVGVALDHRREPLQLLARRGLARRLHRAEHPLGALGHALHRLGILRVDHPELGFERRRVDLVARHVLDREAHEAAAHPRHRARRRVHHLVQRDVEAQVVARERPRLLERVDVRARRSRASARRRRGSRRPARARWATAGRSGRARAARGTRSSTPPARRAAPARASSHHVAHPGHARPCPASPGGRPAASPASSLVVVVIARVCIASPSVVASASSTGRSATRWRSTHPFGPTVGARWRTWR